MIDTTSPRLALFTEREFNKLVEAADQLQAIRCAMKALQANEIQGMTVETLLAPIDRVFCDVVFWDHEERLQKAKAAA